MEQLQQLELLAETLYNPTKTEDYKRAVEMLQGFSTLKYIPQCKFIMDNSKSQFAILFASSSLLKAISANWNGFNQDIQHSFELSKLTTTCTTFREFNQHQQEIIFFLTYGINTPIYNL